MTAQANATGAAGGKRWQFLWAAAGIFLVSSVIAGAWLVFSESPAAASQLERLFSEGRYSDVLHEFQRFEEPQQVGDSEAIVALRSARRVLGAAESKAWLAQAEPFLTADEFKTQASLLQTSLGEFEESPVRQTQALMQQGASVDEAVWCTVQGVIRRGDGSEAARVLARFEHDVASEDPSMELLRVQVANLTSELSDASERIRELVERFPGQELAFLQLEELYSASPQKRRSVLRYICDAFPHNAAAVLRLAELSREQGRPLAPERLALEGANAEANPELSKAMFDSGEYQAFLRLQEQAGKKQVSDYDPLTQAVFRATLEGRPEDGDALAEELRRAAMAYALAGETEKSVAISDLLLTKIGRLRRYIDLVSKTAVFQNDPGLQAAIEKVIDLDAEQPKIGKQSRVLVEPEIEELAGYSLYRNRCANCHGDNGNGEGISARHLYPLPRNLRSHSLRFVSGVKQLPVREDLQRVIRHGLHGVSMPGNEDLSAAEIDQLVDVVIAMRQAGLAERQTDSGLESTLDSERVALPDWIGLSADFTAEMVDEGAKLFESVGCGVCHSERSPPLFDEVGQAVAAPDLERAVLKGGESLESIYYRLRVGLPGSPHPAFQGSEEQIRQLMAWVFSQRSEAQREMTNHQRRTAGVGLPSAEN